MVCPYKIIFVPLNPYYFMFVLQINFAYKISNKKKLKIAIANNLKTIFMSCKQIDSEIMTVFMYKKYKNGIKLYEIVYVIT